MPSNTPKRGIPDRFLTFRKLYPQIVEALDACGSATANAGPMDQKTVELVRLAIAIGARQEGGVHSHTRRALEAGATVDEIRQVALLAITSIGFPNAMAAMSWIEDVV